MASLQTALSLPFFNMQSPPRRIRLSARLDATLGDRSGKEAGFHADWQNRHQSSPKTMGVLCCSPFLKPRKRYAEIMRHPKGCIRFLLPGLTLSGTWKTVSSLPLLPSSPPRPLLLSLLPFPPPSSCSCSSYSNSPSSPFSFPLLRKREINDFCSLMLQSFAKIMLWFIELPS